MQQNTHIAERFQQLFGKQYGVTTWLCKCLGRSQGHVSKILNGQRATTEEWIAIAELLECIPQDRWPQRWRKDTLDR